MSQRKEPRAVVSRVVPGSPAERQGLQAGDVIESINGRPLTDILEYRFQIAGDQIDLDILTADGQHRHVSAACDTNEDFGLEFDDPLFDEVYTCDNKCVFCFVHQSPKKMRRSLYIMDDDYRLSFWHGHFVTMTNLSEEDIQRIIEQGMTPLNISVHSTEDDLREYLMGTPKARGVMNDLKRLIAAGVELNTQLVLIPGVNDGEHLDRSISDLVSLYPGVLTISAVPVGLTKHRQRLHPMAPYDLEGARRTLAQLHAWQERLHAQIGTRLVFAADEFYSKAGLPVPAAPAYEGFPQLENGIGLLRKLKDEVAATEPLLPAALPRPRHVTAITGVSAAPTIAEIIERLNRIDGLQVDLVVVKNDYYGHSVTVTGLLTGHDVAAALAGRDLGDAVCLPEVMFRDGADQRVTLDDWDLKDLSEAFGRPAQRLSRDGRLALEQLVGVSLNDPTRVMAPRAALETARQRRRAHRITKN